MPQIQKGDTFADGQQVTGARLNQLIDSATILPNIILDQTNIAVNGVASNDSLLVYDLSATALREANVSDVLGSNVPVTTSQITAGNASDVTISPQNGTLVAGSAFTSADGLTVVVTSNAHGLVAGQVVTTSASTLTGYNGTFRITAVTTNTFTYVMTVAGTIGSGTISYTKQGVVKITANEVISNNLYVDGNANITGDTNITGNANITGTTTLSGGVASGFNVNGLISSASVPTTANHLTNKTYVDGNFSATTSGYAKLPNGIIFQWGTGNVGAGTGATTTFTTAFPNNCFQVVASWNGTTAISAKCNSVIITTKTLTNFNATYAEYNNAPLTTFSYFAIGN